MSALIRPAVSADINAICNLLHTKMNPKIAVDRWRQLMSYSWLANKPDFGRVVERHGQVLGYCGMVYADRLIEDSEQPGGRRERIVSMSSWYLDKSLRGQGLGRDMLLSAIEDPSLTYVTLTNSRKPLGIVEALGFRVLENHRYVWRRTDQQHPRVTITSEPELVRNLVSPQHRQLIDDMTGLPVVPFLLETDGHTTLFFFSIKKKGADITWFDLMYASNLERFVELAQVLADKLLPEAPSVLAADGRFVCHPPDGAIYERLPVSRYYISERVNPGQIDHLYSELQLLDLKLD